MPTNASPVVDVMSDVNLTGSNSHSYVARQEGLGRLDLHSVPHEKIFQPTRELVALGLEEPMPSQEIIDDL